MSTVLKASDSADFLGLVPALAGFTPRQSIVLVPFQRSRAHGAMRIDLPRDDVELDDYVDSAIGLVSRVTGLDAVAVVVYVDELPQHTPDGLVLPQTVVVEELLAVAVDSGLHLMDALCVMPCGWSSYFDEDPELNPLDEIPAVPAIPGIPDFSGDQDAGATLPTVDLAEKELVGRALHDISDVLARDAGQCDGANQGRRENPQALAAAVLLDDLPEFFEALLEDHDDLPPFETAALLWCLNRPPLRDAALLQWATDLPTGIRAFDAQLAFSATGRSRARRSRTDVHRAGRRTRSDAPADRSRARPTCRGQRTPGIATGTADGGGLDLLGAGAGHPRAAPSECGRRDRSRLLAGATAEHPDGCRRPAGVDVPARWRSGCRVRTI